MGYGKKVINFSKWSLRHSLRKQIPLKQGVQLDSGDQIPWALELPVPRNQFFPGKAFSWLESLFFSSGHKSLFQDPRCDEGFISHAMLYHREEKGPLLCCGSTHVVWAVANP